MALSKNSKILASDVSGAIKSITRSGTTFTYTKLDGTTGTFTQQDNNTTYSAGTGISLSSNAFSLASLHSAAATIGSSSAQTLTYSGTFTIPYVTRDVYGRVSGGGTRTITMPAAPSASLSTVVAAAKVTGTSSSAYTTNYQQNITFGSIVNESYEKNDRSEKRYYVNVTIPAGGTWCHIDSGDIVSGGHTARLQIYDSYGYEKKTTDAVFIRIA